MDMWTPADFKFLLRDAFDELAVMLNMIEEGAEWPEQTKTSRAAFLFQRRERCTQPARIPSVADDEHDAEEMESDGR